MSSWLISVAAIIILTACAELILPEGKTGKLVKSMFSLMCLFVIIMPLQALSKNSDIPAYFFDNQMHEEDQNYLYYFNSQRAKYLSQDGQEWLKRQGFDNTELEIVFDNINSSFIIEKVLVNVANLVILENNQHININIEITRLLADYLSIDKEKVIIYE